MNIKIGETALITTKDWFYAPDGRLYRAVFGTIKDICTDKQVLGVDTNRNSTNWYVEIGTMTIAGCQIFYATRCDFPNFGNVSEERFENGSLNKYCRETHIYNANDITYLKS